MENCCKELPTCRATAIQLRKELVPKLRAAAEDASPDPDDDQRDDYGESEDRSSFGIAEIQSTPIC